jgi:HK97 family phage prohead protease
LRFTKTASLILYKSADGQSLWLEGVASDTSIDRDGDQMSLAVLHSWAKQINEEGLTAFTDHKHELFDSIGIWREAEVVNNSLVVRARLEDPEINPRVKQLLAKIDAGMKIGLSIGGDLRRTHTERRTGKIVRVIDEAPLYEISAVGIPSNENASVVGVVYKSLQKSPNLYDGYNQYQDPAYSGAYVSGRATDSVPGNNKILPSEFSSPFVNQRDWVQQAKPDERFLTGGQPDRDKLLNTRSPMQPEAKIAAEPGKSGSSEVFRTDLGQKIDLNEDEKKALSDIRTWALQKVGAVPERFRDELNQNLARRAALAQNEQTVSQLEQHRIQQERLHSLGQLHDQSVCRHCVGEQPSALNQPRPGQTYTYTVPQVQKKKGAPPWRHEDDDGPMGDIASASSSSVSGNPNVRAEEDIGGMPALGSGAMGEEDEDDVDTGTDARLKILSPSEETASAGTDLRLAPKRRHYSH